MNSENTEKKEQENAAVTGGERTESPAVSPLPGYATGTYGVKIPVIIDEGTGETRGDGEGSENEPLKIFCYSCGQKLDVTGLPAFSVVDCPFCGASLIVPRWFDSYLLEEIVGEGGMATVYRALDPALDREVAVKIMAVTEETEEETLSLFLEEARTAATINHQAVVAIYTCSVAEGKPYIVMEFMAGGSLEKILDEKKGPVDVLQACKWILHVSDGLDRAAKYGIVHHDIKPANIMLDLDGNVKIGDFGIAQRRFDSASSGSGADNSWGSPFYVSPEKAKDGVESFSGDIYSLGATFYHLITGEPPFHGYKDIEELVYVRIEKDPPPPSALCRSIPPEVDSLVMRMMHRDPSMRPGYQQIMAELASFIGKDKTGPSPLKTVPAAVPAGIAGTAGGGSKISYPPPPAPVERIPSSSSSAAALKPAGKEAAQPKEKSAPPAVKSSLKLSPSGRESAPPAKKRGFSERAIVLVAGYIVTSMVVFFIVYILSRLIFASMKG